ncbi:Transcriptional regulator, Fis family [Candidatus Sulfopaludibacter sp. SbA6]|nr:Transcriptional regulator, Fis family [Candidatus Sulfopaludibacter sp. SbA6]
MYRRTLLSLALLVFSAATYGAGDASLDRGTLRGLKALSVIIDTLDPQLEKEGLTPDLLQRQLEARLGHGGVTVDKSAVEFLGLRISSARVKKGPYSLCLTIGLYQPVTLSRDKNLKTATQTWEVGTLLIAQPKVLMQSSTAAVDELADRFVNAWRSVNP